MQLSIIIPTKNRQQVLLESIEYALRAIENFEAEIIVVNDGDAIHNLPENDKLRLLDNNRQGVSKARNMGGREAKYPLLFFIDDDMWITSESCTAIKKLEEELFFSKNCSVLNWQFPDNLISEMKQDKIGRYLIKADFHTMEGRLKQKIDYTTNLFRVNSIGSGSFAIAKQLFFDIGGYNEGYTFQGEDIDLSERLNKSGIGIFISTGITCYHNQRDRLEINLFLDREYRGFLSQFRNSQSTISPNPIKQTIYTALIPFKITFLLLFNIIPNRPVFDFITFRTIGILSSIMYFKAWYNAENK